MTGVMDNLGQLHTELLLSDNRLNKKSELIIKKYMYENCNKGSLVSVMS